MNITRRIKQIVIVSAIFYGWHIPFDSTGAFAQNAIAAERVTFEGPGGNVGAMRETTKITRVEVNEKGIVITADKLALPVTRGGSGWPDTCTPFENCEEPGIQMGALQYSLGFVLPVNGQLFGSAPIENWYGRENGGTGMITDQSVTCTNGVGQFQCNLYYDGRWPNLRQVRPQPGDEVGVFVLAGDARNGYVPLQERSNIVTFKLPVPGGSGVWEYAGQGGGSIAADLAAERAKYGATINGAQGAAILNAVAFKNGLSLLGKEGGSHCFQPTTNKSISCDYLIINRGGVWFGQDVLIAAPGPDEQSAGTPVGDVTFPDNMQDAINNGSRSVVAAVDPGGVGPQLCADPKANNVGKPLPCTYDQQPPDLTARVIALEAAKAALEAQVSTLTAQLTDAQGELRAQRDALSSLDAAQHALEAQVQSLVGKPIPVGCKANINLGGVRIGIHCELTY